MAQLLFDRLHCPLVPASAAFPFGRVPGEPASVSIVVVADDPSPRPPRVLTSLFALAIPDGVDVELLISVHASAVLSVRNAASGCPFPIRVVEELAGGLSDVRNALVQQSRGRIVAMPHPAVVCDSGWLTGLLHAYLSQPAHVVAGQVALQWESGSPPAWLKLRHYPLLAGCDLGPEIVTLAGRWNVVGPNFAFRRTVFDSVHGFTPGLDSVRGDAWDGAIPDFLYRARTLGFPCLYVPAASVTYAPPAAALDRAALEEAAHRHGYAYGLIHPPPAPHRLRRMARRAARSRVRETVAQLRGDEASAVKHALHRREILGRCEGAAQLAAGRTPARPEQRLAPSASGAHALPKTISIVIPTHNRAAALAVALETLAAQDFPPDFDLELVVVANACTDNTAEVVAAKARLFPFPVRVVEEPVANVARARNRCVIEARGDIVVMVDDDVRVQPGWFAGILAAFCCYPADLVVGRVNLSWETVQPPEWISPQVEQYLSQCDLGEAPRELFNRLDAVGAKDAISANYAFRRHVFDEVGGFTPGLGRTGSVPLAGEETEFSARALELGFRMFYTPHAAAKHWVDPQRVSQAYMTRIAYHHARSWLFIQETFDWPIARRQIRRGVRRILRSYARQAAAHLRRDAPRVMHHRMRRHQAWGEIVGSIEVVMRRTPAQPEARPGERYRQASTS